MRVCVLHDLPAGGARRRLSEQVRRLDADVVEVCLATAEPFAADALVVPYRPLAPELPRAARPPFRYRDLSALELAWRRAAVEVDRLAPDVVYANPCRFLRAPAALCHVAAPSLYFCDEPFDGGTPSPRTQRLYGPLYERVRRLDREAVGRATSLATNSAFTARSIRRAYGREAAVLPMGVPDGFTPGADPPRHLLSVGTLIPDKGHELVLEAAALGRRRLPVLVVAPRPDRAGERHLRALAARLGVELEVAIGITDAQLVDAYRSAFVTLYLAREEPFGLASLEAQACGSPVIVTAAGGLPETIRDGVTGWAVAREPAAAAACIDALADADLRARMAAAALVHGAGASWDRAADALRRRLETTAASGAAGREVSRWTS